MTEWQDIETAPRHDEADILTWNGYVIRTANWDEKSKSFRVNVHSFGKTDATHWQPLPEPPTDTR